MGDFYAPRIDWTTCPPTPLDAVDNDIIEFCEAMNMTQLVPKPTKNDSILDIILTQNQIASLTVFLKRPLLHLIATLSFAI